MTVLRTANIRLFTFYSILSAQFSSIKYIHTVGQWSSPSISRTLFILRYGNSICIKQLPIPPSPQSLGTTPVLSVSVIRTMLSTSWKWHHAVFVYLWLPLSLNKLSSRFFHVVTCSMFGNFPPIFPHSVWCSLWVFFNVWILICWGSSLLFLVCCACFYQI